MPSARDTITTVFFDMDETLVEHSRTGLELCQDTFAAHADYLAEVDMDLFIKTLWQKANDMWNMMFDGVLSGDVARVYAFKNTLRTLEADDTIAESMQETFETLMLDSTQLTDGALDVLETLRASEYTLGMITNGYTAMQERKIAYHGLDKIMNHVFISEAMGVHKPDARIFTSALEQSGASPFQAVHVGDNLRADVAGAIGAGMSGLLFDPKGARTRKLEADASLTKPTHIVQSLREVASWLGA